MSVIVRSTYNRFFFNHRKFSFRVLSRNFAAPRKRFYKKVHVFESDGGFEVCLDKHKLKTPLENFLHLPNEALAVAVATEWDIQQDTLQQHNMHITALCNTALDNPCRQTKETIVDSTLQFLVADTLCYRSVNPPDFSDLQKEKWDPILEWFQARYNVKINICEDVSNTPIPHETIVQIQKHLLSYNYWCLIGINFIAENLKSLILTLAVVNHKLDVEEAVGLSRLEALFQIKRWGNVEWAHDVDQVQTTARVAAGAIFTYLNEGSSDFLEKMPKKKESHQRSIWSKMNDTFEKKLPVNHR